MTDEGWEDGSILEAASWRLASELARRHPTTTRLCLTHPGGGQYDCLQLDSSIGAPGTVMLNRAGSIHVLARFDGREVDWPSTSWDAYLRADPRKFLDRLERGAGLPTPTALPPATPRTLSLRILAALAATAIKTVHPLRIESGMNDTSGYGHGPNRTAFECFPHIPAELMAPRATDAYGAAEYRFWFVLRDDVPVLAIEQQQGLAWMQHHQVAIELMNLYDECRRNILVTTLKLLRQIDNV